MTKTVKDLARSPQLTIPEVLERLRCGRSYLHELLASGALPSCRVGRRLVPAAAVEEFLADRLAAQSCHLRAQIGDAG